MEKPRSTNLLRKEAFQGHPWYPSVEAFLAQGYCEVGNDDYAVVMAALERLGYETEAIKGQTDATTRLCGSDFPFPSDEEQEQVEERFPSVAEQILLQLGGRRFMAMTGSKNFLADGNTLQMQLAKNQSGANRLHITLNGMDLYDMRFFYYRMPNVKCVNGKMIETPAVEREIKRYEDVYNDMLCELFTEVTGLYTHL